MPKIERIELTSLEHVLAGKAYGNAHGLNNRRGCSLIEVHTDDGIVGYGDATGPLAVIRGYLEMIKPNFIGTRLYDFDMAAAKTTNRLYHFGFQSHLTSTIGGLNVAVYDALGKTLGLPVHDLLGGRRVDVVPCYATTGYITEDPSADLEPQLATMQPGVFAGAKIKIGISPASDLERVRIARRVLGDDALLMVDMNANYTLDVALQSLRLIEPFNIHWCEEPLLPSDIAGYTELRRRSPISISAGEAHYTAHDFKRLVDARALDILQPSIVTGGGFEQAKAVALLASINNLRISPASWGSSIAIMASAHFITSLPPDHAPFPVLLEYDIAENPFRDELLTTPLQLGPGGLVVPRGPGLGIEINQATVEKYARR